MDKQFQPPIYHPAQTIPTTHLSSSPRTSTEVDKHCDR